MFAILIRALGLALIIAVLRPGPLAAQPLVDRYLKEGKLSEGDRELRIHLEKNPRDDEARFGLGLIQFLQTFEHFGASLYKYGMRTERISRRPPPIIRQWFPQNPNPEKINYQAIRKILQRVNEDLMRADTTLAQIKDPNVTLAIVPGQIRLDLFGLGKPVSGTDLFTQFNAAVPRDAADNFVVKFDRGDVNWLRGYCHFLAAWSELALAVDGKELFECTAHLIFEKVETPHKFLLQNRKPLDDSFPFNNVETILDLITGIHLSLRFKLAEPKRMANAHRHLQQMVKHGKQMWQFYEAETDDDREWIPNPRQTGAMGIGVSKEMRTAWLATLEEADLVLQGKRLLPFWRGQPGKRGVNLRRVFLEPREIDVIRWIQGTAATPYLEDGPITRFAEENFFRQLNDIFGGSRFFGFAFWFN